ncbi:hypothetical protein PCANC_00109 [Puccinia coronata f. sp. avenae]|uniref:Uncharacterized protein n=1 Tax=Puccinia coronata f. sp. avenae TaxID=200324 RepID=A0A2N5W8N3_9BASI|nr:hypothetical protein PCANC_00109 [Puccinia coronata f. sp. avenae]
MQPVLSNLLGNLNNDEEEIGHLHQQRIGLNHLAVSSGLNSGQQCANGFLQIPTLLADQLPADEDSIHPDFRIMSPLNQAAPSNVESGERSQHPLHTLVNINAATCAKPKPSEELLSDDEIARLEKLPLDELRRLQTRKEYVQYQRLNYATKTEAEKIYHEYQKQILLLAFKHKRPAVAVSQYLGQGRKRENNSWNNYRALNNDAKTEFKNVSDNLGKRNQTVAAQWHQLDPATQKLYKSKSFLDSLKTQDGLDLPMRTGRTPSTKNLFTAAKVWAKDVSGKLKELSDELAIEGFIVMASRDHLDPFYYQGGTILANQYLKMIVEEGDPMGGFHSFVAGIKKRCRVVDVNDKSVSEVARPKKIRRVNGLEEFLDVDKGGLSENQNHITNVLREMCLKANPAFKLNYWPGTNTKAKLAENHLEVKIKEDNFANLTKADFCKVIKKTSIHETWRTLRGLEKKWIQIVKIQDTTENGDNPESSNEEPIQHLNSSGPNEAADKENS